MKLISINIENNLHYKTVLPFLEKEEPDVICVQELLEDDFNFFKKELKLDGVFCSWHRINGPNYKELLGKKNGIAIFAKKIKASDYYFHIGKEENIVKSFEEYMSNEDFQRNSAFAWVDTESDDGKICRVITTHVPVTKHGESTPYQIEVVDALISQLENMGEFVLCGDMNAPRGNETFAHLAKKYKDNIPLECKTSIDQNLHRMKGIQFMVDGLFTTSKYKAKNVKLVDGISDHMAIVAEISKE